MGKPARTTNLRKLCEELGQDLVGAALGLDDDAMRVLLEGRGHPKEDDYNAHLTHRMSEVGIPAGWLDKQYSATPPSYIRSLRALAAESPNKAPIRRANFKKVAEAFEGREEILSDALDMVPSAIRNVAAGLLLFDDGRFSHVNPRLMKAGFPDGWLEQPEPKLEPEMVQSLEKQAVDELEREHAEFQADHAQSQAAEQAAASLAQTQTSSKTSQFAEESAAQEEFSLTPSPAPSDTPKEPAMPTARSVTKTPKKSSGKGPSLKPFQGVLPTAPKAPGKPAAGPRKNLPLAILAGQQPAAPKGMPKAAAAGAPKKPGSKPTKAPVASGLKSAPIAAAAQSPKASPVAPAPAGKKRGPRVRMDKEVSQRRAVALAQLLENQRRGVKSALWDNIMGSSLAMWGNMRRGTVAFKDETADKVTAAMGLPEGWLDDPVFPPPSLAQWVTDPEAPLPTGETQAVRTAPRSPTMDRSKTAPPRATPTPHAAVASAPSAPPARAAASAPTVAPAPSAPTPARAAPAPSQAPAAIPSASNLGPLTTALLAVIANKAAAGAFTEIEALKLLNELSR